MNFTQKNIKTEYRSLRNNIVKEFYIPLLEDAVLYQRAVGFFSSSALVEISKGIIGLLKNGGKIQLVASPKLTPEDIEAIEKGYKLKNEVIEKRILNSFTEPSNIFEEERLNLLAHLIRDGRLEIKIAFLENSEHFGMFHEKMGLIFDKNNNVVAFTGSMNETSTAFSYNYESIDVFCSWNSESERVTAKQEVFMSIWNDNEPNIKIMNFPEIAKEKFESYKKTEIDMNIDEKEYCKKTKKNTLNQNYKGPRIPSDVELHDYQIRAIEEWKKNNFVGIFDMATGTGKTYTGLGAISHLYKYLDYKLGVIIVCPYQHLVEQWVEDILKFGMKPIVGYSASKQKNWKVRLKDAVISYNLGVKDHFCFITTNATFSSDFVQDQINKSNRNVILLIDEAHNFGAKNLSNHLSTKIPYRLALSATLDRHGDEEGTSKLYNYFGEKCIEYTLKEAIDSKKLTPYYYYPIVVSLTEKELEDYKNITGQIFKQCSLDKKGKIQLTETGKMLLIKRARLVAAAQEKILKLKKIITPYKEDTHMLIYCGAATLEDPNYLEGLASNYEKRQIDIVADKLGNELNMKISKFTSEESAEEREELKAAFSEGKHLQALIAIRCLDEGVNIPSIKTAFILASSTNPKEYIQRRGRVLRKYPGKEYAVIYDFITLPVSMEEACHLQEDEIRIIKSLANKEINRMKDFASIAENPSVADQLINNISEIYNLNEMKEMEGDNYEI